MPVEAASSTLPENFSPPPIVQNAQIIDGQKVPSLLSLFMTDFKGVGAVLGQWTDIKLRSGTKEFDERVQFRVYNDIHKHVRFIAYYMHASVARAAAKVAGK